MKPKRFGKFYVSRQVLEQENFSEILAKIKFVPHYVHCVNTDDTFEFIGTSPLFQEVLEGFTAIVYEINVTDSDPDNFIVKVTPENL